MVDEFMDAVFTRWPDVIVQVNVHRLRASPLMELQTGLYHWLMVFCSKTVSYIPPPKSIYVQNSYCPMVIP